MSKPDKRSFIIGVDLGQAQDYTAISVLEKINKYNLLKGCYKEPFYHCRYLQRPKLNTPYPAIVKHVRAIYENLKREPLNRDMPYLAIDSTGCGRPVYDMFKQAGLHPKGINIHGGYQVSYDNGFYNVPKRDLVGFLQMLFQTNRLKVAEALPEAKTLIEELINFKVKININTAHDSYEAWREGIHDDLVLSVACAAWWGEKSGKGLQILMPGGME